MMGRSGVQGLQRRQSCGDGRRLAVHQCQQAAETQSQPRQAGGGRHGAGCGAGLLYLIAVSSISPAGDLPGRLVEAATSIRCWARCGPWPSSSPTRCRRSCRRMPIVLWAGSLSLVTIFDRQLEFGWFIMFSPPGLFGLRHPD